MYKLSRFSRNIINNEQIILCNTSTGSYIKTKKKYFDCIKNILEESTGDKILCKKLKESKLEKLFTNLVDIEYYVELTKIEENKLNIVYIAITNRCNLNCIHCTAKSNINEIDTLSLKEIYAIIDQICDVNPRIINITGGEPLIRKDILQILNYIRNKYSGYIVLSTNGILINKNNIDFIISNVDEVSISLDGYNQESVEKIRGKGAYTKVIDTIELLHKKDFNKVSLSMLSSKYTENNDDEFRKLCCSLKVHPIIHRFTPNGRGAQNIDKIFTEKVYLENNVRKAYPKLCFPGEKELFIDKNGDVYPCGNLADNKNLKMGNILECEIKEIMDEWNINKSIENLRPWRNEKCKDCKVNLFCHSCISNIINLQENDKFFQIMCSITYKRLYEIIWKGGE